MAGDYSTLALGIRNGVKYGLWLRMGIRCLHLYHQRRRLAKNGRRYDSRKSRFERRKHPRSNQTDISTSELAKAEDPPSNLGIRQNSLNPGTSSYLDDSISLFQS